MMKKPLEISQKTICKISQEEDEVPGRQRDNSIQTGHSGGHRGDERECCPQINWIQGVRGPPYSKTRKVNFPSDSRTTSSQTSCERTRSSEDSLPLGLPNFPARFLMIPE